MTTMVFSPRPHQRRRSSTRNNNRTSLPSQSPIFHFTPRPTFKRAPRPWDREPCAPANPFSRNRKVWKRVVDQQDADLEADVEVDGDRAEAKGDDECGGDVYRGVKRMRVNGNGDDEAYVETKWVDAETRNRKLPVGGLLGQYKENGLQDSLSCDPDTTAASQLNMDLAISLSTGDDDDDVMESAIVTDDDGDSVASITIHSPTTDNMDSSVPRSIFDEQDATTNESDDLANSPQLRYSLLEGDLAEVLSDFLTRAKAKRAAGSGPNVKQDPDNISSESPKKSLSHSPGTPSRQALGVLDQNSPSPTKRASSTQTPSQPPHETVPAGENIDMAVKGRKRKARERAPTGDAPTETAELDPPADAEPARRKTAPTRATRSRRNTSTAPNTINLRRAKGTEFVFMQRSEAQQLALTTKANTRKNKGDAQLPLAVLPNLQARTEEDQAAHSPEPETEGQPCEQEEDGRKRVRFDEENLVSYCDAEEKGLVALEDVGLEIPARKKKNRDKSTNEKKEKAAGEEEKDEQKENTPPLPLLSPSVPRKVRRLGPARDSSLLRPKNDNVPGSDERGALSDANSSTHTSASSGVGIDLPKEPTKKKVAIGSKRSAVPRPVSATKVKEKKENIEEDGVMDFGWKAAARRKGSGTGNTCVRVGTPAARRVKREVK